MLAIKEKNPSEMRVLLLSTALFLLVLIYLFIFFFKLNNLFTGKIKTNIFFLLPVAVKFNKLDAFKEVT